MSTNTEEIVVVLQLELSEKLDALKAQGMDEADIEAETKKLLLEFGARVQAATVAKAQVSTSSSSSSSSSGTTTIFAEQAEKFSLKSTKNEDLQIFGEKLKAKAVQTGRNATEAQLKAMTTEKDRAIITQGLRRFKFADGVGIENAEKWLQWDNNEALCDIFKLVFPKSEAQSDSQKLLAMTNSSKAFKIHHCKDPQHFLSFVADIQLELHYDDRQEEFDNLNSVGYTLLKDIILDQVMGRKASSCEVTRQLIADIKAKAPSTLIELLDTITDEGILLHTFAVDCERRGIPFLPFKRNVDKDDKGGNDPKKPRLEGGGQTKTQCKTCGKYHLGHCDPNKNKGGGDNKTPIPSSSSSSSSSKQGANSGQVRQVQSSGRRQENN